MATTTVSFSVRTDPTLKKQVDLFLENVGMSMSTAINLYLRKIVQEQRIPFEVRRPDRKTRKAIADAEQGKDVSKSFDTVEDLMEDLKE